MSMSKQLLRLRRRSLCIHVAIVMIAVTPLLLIFMAALPSSVKALLLGAIVCLTGKSVLSQRFRRGEAMAEFERLPNATVPAEAQLLGAVQRLSGTIGMYGSVETRISSGGVSASVCYRRRHVLTVDEEMVGFLARRPVEEMEALVAHELWHAANFDTRLAPVYCLGYGWVAVVPVFYSGGTLEGLLAAVGFGVVLVFLWRVALNGLNWAEEFCADRAAAIVTKRSAAQIMNHYRWSRLPSEQRPEGDQLPFLRRHSAATKRQRWLLRLLSLPNRTHPTDEDRHEAVRAFCSE